MSNADEIYDEWLVLRCQGSDAAALAILVQRWHPRLFGFAIRWLGGCSLGHGSVGLGRCGEADPFNQRSESDSAMVVSRCCQHEVAPDRRRRRRSAQTCGLGYGIGLNVWLSQTSIRLPDPTPWHLDTEVRLGEATRADHSVAQLRLRSLRNRHTPWARRLILNSDAQCAYALPRGSIG